MSYTASSDQPQQRGGCGCCGTGCFLVFLLLLLVIAGGAALYFQVPQRVGLIQSPTQRLLASTPDREAAATILQDLQQAGLDTRGMELYVVPYRDGSGVVAYAVLDPSQGFTFPQNSQDPVVGFLTGLAQGGAAEQYGVKRVAIEYRNSEGQPLVTMTATTQALQDYANGKISRQKLLQAIDGKAGVQGLATEVLP